MTYPADRITGLGNCIELRHEILHSMRYVAGAKGGKQDKVSVRPMTARGTQRASLLPLPLCVSPPVSLTLELTANDLYVKHPVRRNVTRGRLLAKRLDDKVLGDRGL